MAPCVSRSRVRRPPPRTHAPTYARRCLLQLRSVAVRSGSARHCSSHRGSAAGPVSKTHLRSLPARAHARPLTHCRSPATYPSLLPRRHASAEAHGDRELARRSLPAAHAAIWRGAAAAQRALQGLCALRRPLLTRVCAWVRGCCSTRLAGSEIQAVDNDGDAAPLGIRTVVSREVSL